MKKAKLAFIGNSSLTMYNFRFGTIKALFESGYDVTVLAPIDSDIKAFETAGIRIIPIHVDCRGMNPIRDFQLMWQLRRLYKQERFDFIFHYTIKPVIYGSLAAEFTRMPYISVITGLGYTFMHQNLLKRLTIKLYSLALKKAKEVWFLNEDDMGLFLTEKIIGSEKAFILNGEGVNTTNFRPQPKKKEFFSFIFIGRILWDKGIGEYIQAVKKLKDKYPHVRFQILGPLGAENPAAINPEEMRTWVNEGIVDYLGTTNKVSSYIANCDCLVLPSYREGLSRILLEAAAMERPIIASNVTGCKEIVEDGVNGYLCPPQDADSLMHCMEKMYLLSQEERTEMGKNGRNIVLSKFDEQIIIDIYQKKLDHYLNLPAK